MIMMDLSAAEPQVRALDPKVAGKIRRLHSLCSSYVDLLNASEALRVARDHGAGTGPGTKAITDSADYAVIVRSLIAHAVVLFCRATGTETKARDIIQFADNASHPLHIPASHVRALRNKAIAHFGDGGELIARPWVREKLVQADRPAPIKPEFLSNRIGVDGPIIEDLAILLPAAEQEFVKRKEDADAVLSEALSKVTDESVLKILFETTVDDEKFFGMTFAQGQLSTDRRGITSWISEGLAGDV